MVDVEVYDDIIDASFSEILEGLPHRVKSYLSNTYLKPTATRA